MKFVIFYRIKLQLFFNILNTKSVELNFLETGIIIQWLGYFLRLTISIFADYFQVRRHAIVLINYDIVVVDLCSELFMRLS